MVVRYPATLDTGGTHGNLPDVIDLKTPVTGATFNRLRDTILAIEKELGVKPSGTQSTVAGRLTTLEGIVNNLQPIELVQDLSGTLTRPLVVGLQGHPISGSDPTPGEVLTWNGILWSPEPLQLSGFTDVLTPPDVFVEVGQVLYNPLFNGSYSSVPISASIIDNQGNAAQDVFAAPSPSDPPNTFVYPHTYQFNSYPATPHAVLFTLSASDGVTTATNTAAITWVQRVYFGAGPVGGNTASFIQSLVNNPLTDAGTVIFAANAGANQAIYYAYRTAYGVADFFVEGWEGGFNLVSTTIAVTNAHGFTENYTLYQSAQTNLGKTIANVTYSNNINGITSDFSITTALQTLLPMGGDVTGFTATSTVVGLQNRPVASTAPLNGQMLGWNGSTWTPTSNLFSNIASITNSYLAPATSQTILVGTLAAPITVTLPASPGTGQTIIVKDLNASAGSNRITISGNGNTIDGGSSFFLNVNYESVTLVFGGSSWGVV